jgi:putative ABC transport system permease protein
MMLLKLAWRNVFRHKRRTMITATAISVGLGAMIMSNTMMNGMDSMASFNIINYESGHLEIFKTGYYREEGLFPLDTIIEEPAPLIEAVRNIPGVQGVTARVKFPARISNGIDEYPVLGVGIDPVKDRDVFKIAQSVVSGRYFENTEDILIGAELARTMEIDIGSFITVITRDQNGTYNAYDFIVSGVLVTDHPLFDANAVVMDLAITQELLALGQGVTELSIRLGRSANIQAFQTRIAEVVGNEYEVLNYKEVYGSIFEVSGFKRFMQFMVALIVVVIAAVGIINTMLMAVMERIPEIGTLKAMGFQNNVIIKLFMYEGGIIGMFGSLLGCVYGLIVSLYFVIIGLDFSSFFDAAEMGYPVKFIMKGQIDFGMVVTVFLFGIIVSLLVTLWPVRRATRLQPVDALRHV